MPGLRKRSVRLPKNAVPPDYLAPTRRKSTCAQSVDFKYFDGHVIPEIAKKLPKRNVFCWKTENMLSLPTCALMKFWQLERQCKRCSLFQKDENSKLLRSLVVEWERDDWAEEDADV